MERKFLWDIGMIFLLITQATMVGILVFAVKGNLERAILISTISSLSITVEGMGWIICNAFVNIAIVQSRMTYPMSLQTI